MNPGKKVSFQFDGKTYNGFAGDTVASALWANGIRKLRVHEESATPRSVYCNIGHCFECRLTINQTPGVRACLTEIKENMIIESGKRQPAPLKRTGDGDDLPRTYDEYIRKQNADKEGHPHV